jgi:para-aminobenzoate synthetase component I
VGRIFTTVLPYEDPLAFAQAVADRPFCALLDSGLKKPESGEWSFIAAEPFAVWRVANGVATWNGIPESLPPFESLQVRLADYADRSNTDAPFAAGAIGYFTYEAGALCEPDLPRAYHESKGYDAEWAFYDTVLAVHHPSRQAWLHTQTLTHESVDRHARFAALFHNPASLRVVPTPLAHAWQPHLKEATFCARVEQLIERIRAGDLFQANLAMPWSARYAYAPDAVSLYAQARAQNPSPFAAMLRFGERTLISRSPERFLQVRGNRVRSDPIKGTRPRGSTPLEDAIFKRNLASDPKERAENVMIVDVMRNDLSRVCVTGSVHVPKLCEVQTFASVHHLVSVVEGTLERSKNVVDLLQAALPAASISGAPKRQACLMIKALEDTPRGVYCGTIGFIGFNGNMDINVAIRTMIVEGVNATLYAGSGITAQSIPHHEYQETVLKARSVF